MASGASLGLLLLPDLEVPALERRAARAEELGYDSVWVADEKFYRDPWVLLASIARVTHHVVLGTGVTEPYARHPALLAMAIGTLAEVAGDRVVLGLGAGGSGFPAMGIERRRPALAIREAVSMIRALLGGDSVTYEGAVLSARDARLHFAASPVPIYVAARGHAMLRSAGAVGDGVIVAPFASPQAVTGALRRAESGAQDAGAQRPRMVVRVDVCIGRTAAEARDAVRYFVALPLWSSYPDFAYVEDVGIRLPEAVRELLGRRDYGAIAEVGVLVPPEMIDHFSVAGTREQVLSRLNSLAPLADEIVVHPVRSTSVDVDEVISIVAEAWHTMAPTPRMGAAR